MLKESRPRPLPGALRRRLRDIPRREAPCRDVDRLYRATRLEARGGAPDPGTPRDRAAEGHLAECGRCRELYATLADAFAVRRLPLPRRLAGDLAAIARHPQRFLPLWIADTRYAAAACYLLAALALSLAGDASALLRDTAASVGSQAQVWVDRREARGREVWEAATATLGREVEDGWHRAARVGASYERFLTGVYETLETSTLELMPGRERPVEGDDDDRADDDRD